MRTGKIIEKCNNYIFLKASALIAIAVISIIVTILTPPIPQPESYHLFSDGRRIWQIPNFFNVITNLPFISIGITGLAIVKRSLSSLKPVYVFLFIGMYFTGLGSMYYHLSPRNETLVYDRIPMTIIFMSFFALVIGETIHKKAAILLLFPLLSLGISCVLWWHYTNDLRLYAFVQYYPVVSILFLLFFPSGTGNPPIKALSAIIAFYALSKIFERFDERIFSLTGFISGHSLKHLTASIALWLMLRMCQIGLRYGT